MTGLGGPGPGCSATRVRRLEAGELQGDERARTEEHVAGCARCQGTRLELEEERRALAAVLPFEAFAAGVAERLAGRERPRRAAALRWAPLALAAALALGVAVPLVLRTARGPGDDVRSKGAPALAAWVEEGGAARPLAAGEPVPRGASLRVALPRGVSGHAAVVLLDRDGAAPLYAGPAAPGPVPGAFEWTADGEATIVAVVARVPVDPAALAERLARGGQAAAAPPGDPGAAVLTLQLRRGGGR